jgi:hypothetical protein
MSGIKRLGRSMGQPRPAAALHQHTKSSIVPGFPSAIFRQIFNVSG